MRFATRLNATVGHTNGRALMSGPNTHLDDDKLMELLIKTTQGMIWQCPECFAILGKEMTPPCPCRC